jgi:hypothetical protein
MLGHLVSNSFHDAARRPGAHGLLKRLWKFLLRR